MRLYDHYVASYTHSLSHPQSRRPPLGQVGREELAANELLRKRKRKVGMDMMYSLKCMYMYIHTRRTHGRSCVLFCAAAYACTYSQTLCAVYDASPLSLSLFPLSSLSPSFLSPEEEEKPGSPPTKKPKVDEAAATAAAAAPSSGVPGGPVEIVFSFDTTGSMYPCLTQVGGGRDGWRHTDLQYCT